MSVLLVVSTGEPKDRTTPSASPMRSASASGTRGGLSHGRRRSHAARAGQDPARGARLARGDALRSCWRRALGRALLRHLLHHPRAHGRRGRSPVRIMTTSTTSPPPHAQRQSHLVLRRSVRSNRRRRLPPRAARDGVRRRAGACSPGERALLHALRRRRLDGAARSSCAPLAGSGSGSIWRRCTWTTPTRGAGFGARSRDRRARLRRRAACRCTSCGCAAAAAAATSRRARANCATAKLARSAAGARLRRAS